ncbi:hypothetical protein HJC23_000053 [Cyclotella cryptica]|uniref:Ribosomal RNA-processing protein 42 n=1 Tax=Cyclotella cryptica TaxID=29204 RepID=A0ABD3PHI5_9STRA|eukprot:CCRYP_014356-RA/>CCRYP_014356-RA protein AED:0.00 eAED:0.00 QI:130/1/1/1/0/0/2/151/368
MAISPTEAHYIIESALHDFRIDGRSRLEHRPYSVGTRPSTTTTATSSSSCLILSNGSSRIHLPGSSTDILCSVKADLVRPSPNKPNEGVVEISVDSSLAGGLDLSLGGAGGGGGTAAKRQLRERESQITSLLQRLVVPHAVHYRELAICPGKYVWRLSVDIVVLRCDGCVLDGCAMAMREGLRSTLLPRVSAVMNGEEGVASGVGDHGGSSNNDLIVEGDVRMALPPPGVEDCPLVVTVGVLSAPMGAGGRVRHVCVVDARTEEEACASSRVCVSVDRKGMVCGVHTLGGGGMENRMEDEFGGLGLGISSSMPVNMLGDVVNTAAGAAKNLYEMLDREKELSDGKDLVRDDHDTSGYGNLLKSQLLIR